GRLVIGGGTRSMQPFGIMVVVRGPGRGRLGRGRRAGRLVGGFLTIHRIGSVLTLTFTPRHPAVDRAWKDRAVYGRRSQDPGRGEKHYAGYPAAGAEGVAGA